MPHNFKSPRPPVALEASLTDELLAQDARDLYYLSDLRRVHRRDIVERVIERAQALPPRERSMVEGIYLRRLSANKLARELGINPRTVRRDVHNAVRRLLAPFFPFILTHRDGWTGHRRQVAQLCHIEGMSLRAAAHVIGISFYKVRRHDEAIRLLFEAHETARRRAS